jgi:hypothetical protein
MNHFIGLYAVEHSNAFENRKSHGTKALEGTRQRCLRALRAALAGGLDDDDEQPSFPAVGPPPSPAHLPSRLVTSNARPTAYLFSQHIATCHDASQLLKVGPARGAFVVRALSPGLGPGLVCPRPLSPFRRAGRSKAAPDYAPRCARSSRMTRTSRSTRISTRRA